MNLFFEEKKTNGLFVLRTDDKLLKGDGILTSSSALSTIVYNRKKAQTVIIDEAPYTFPSNSILPLVSNQHFKFEHPHELLAWQFNRDFYCISDHDAEVSCVGFLFYGIRNPLFIHLSPQEQADIDLIEKLCAVDMQVKDRMQGEMLRTLLKRLIINVTRIARKQTETTDTLTDDKFDIVRMFNLLLEGHFKTEHAVQFYAHALNKSPKTLSNLFALLNYPAPSKLIQERIILEAKRYLNYTDKSAKEIAYALGFISPAHFSRFFKQCTGDNISAFRSKDEVTEGTVTV
jgi:AraC family transcriptional activator of pobA